MSETYYGAVNDFHGRRNLTFFTSLYERIYRTFRATIIKEESKMVKGFFEKVKKMVDDFIYNVKTMFRQAVDKILKFVQENPELSVAIATVAVPAVVKGVKSISNAVEAKCEERHRLRQTYDRRTDEYLNLKRPLKAKEKEELAIRMDRGESKTMILMDMGLLSW